MICVVAQESVILSECCILLNMTFWSCIIEVFQEMAYFNVKCHFVYTMKIHKYERKILIKKYAHNITQFGIIYIYIESHDDVFIILHTMKVRIYCLLMMFVDVGN